MHTTLLAAFLLAAARLWAGVALLAIAGYDWVAVRYPSDPRLGPQQPARSKKYAAPLVVRQPWAVVSAGFVYVIRGRFAALMASSVLSYSTSSPWSRRNAATSRT